VYKVGDCVIYPNHGVAMVEEIANTVAGGQGLTCLRLRILSNDATVVVPTQNLTSIGIRPTIGRNDVRAIFARLRATLPKATGDWKGRYKENSERMRSGQIAEVADVLRSLTSLAESKSLSYRERAMLDKARELVVGEIAVVESSPTIEVERAVDQALART